MDSSPSELPGKPYTHCHVRSKQPVGTCCVVQKAQLGALSSWTTGVPRPGVRCHPAASGISTNPPKGRGVASQGVQLGEGRAGAPQGGTVGPNIFGTRDRFCGRCFHGWWWGEVQGDSSTLLLCTLLLLLLHQLHPGIRSWRLGTPGVGD